MIQTAAELFSLLLSRSGAVLLTSISSFNGHSDLRNQVPVLSSLAKREKGAERVRNFSKGTQPVPWDPPSKLLSSTLEHSTEGQDDMCRDQKTRDSKEH